jgi:hypothetical protein
MNKMRHAALFYPRHDIHERNPILDEDSLNLKPVIRMMGMEGATNPF